MDYREEIEALQRNLVTVKAARESALNRTRSLEQQLRVTEESLERVLQELRVTRRGRKETDHYKSLLHELRSRWYLRPFISQSKLRPPTSELADRWEYRGPYFTVPLAERQRKRVLVVGHLLSSRLFGSENSLLETIAAIDLSRFDVFAVFPEKNEEVFAMLQPYVQGIAVLDYEWWHKDLPIQEETVFAFGELCRSQAIDLVHVNTIMLREPLIAARRIGIPTITHARELISLDHDLSTRLGDTPAEIVKEVCANTTYLLANSASTLRDYPCGERGGFLYNSIDERSFDLHNSVDPRRIKVGMISSNLRKKGVLDFLELARLAEDVLPRLQFHLIGPETTAVRGWRASLEPSGPLPDVSFASRNLHIFDYVSPPASAYRDLNIVVNLSRFAESFGRTVAEAMTARRPVIAYRFGALPELIDDGETGFLVPYLDLPAVLDRLRFFAENPEKITEFGETARHRSVQRFSRAAFEHGLNMLYGRLIAEAGQPR
jgi:glycosyltransferase involved in cell wall biosynthesis